MAIELYRAQIEMALSQFIQGMGEKNALRDACEYALSNGGKRFRPVLVLTIADALALGADVVPAALSVELFHTASLIADDLPCMDNDDLRRDRPSVHKRFGESLAILASYALIAEGYGALSKNGEKDLQSLGICLDAVTRCAGIRGATNGQFLDLFSLDQDFKTIEKIIYQKTITLFEVSFIFGWVFGGGSLKRLDEVKDCAYHLGMAFQIADDLLDEPQDVGVNIVSILGKEDSLRRFNEEMMRFISSLKALGLWSLQFQEIAGWLKSYAPTSASVDFFSPPPAIFS